MQEMKERILTTALRLFAQNGYEATPVSAIAASVQVTKGALYKHYRDKRDIFDQIVLRMEQRDANAALAFSMPGARFPSDAPAYQSADAALLGAYAFAMFRYWTQDAFASDFRRLLTIEQFRSPEMASLFCQYLSGGVVDYLADLFREMHRGSGASGEDAAQTALAFYAPLFLLYSVYDAAADKAAVLQAARTHIDHFLNLPTEREPNERKGDFDGTH